MRRLLAIAFLSLIAVAGIACDSFERIEFENRSTETINILYGHGATPRKVGTTNSTGECAICDLSAGDEDSFLDPPSDPDRGRMKVYRLTARETTSDIIIYSRVFTWDELRDLDWRVVITDMRE